MPLTLTSTGEALLLGQSSSVVNPLGVVRLQVSFKATAVGARTGSIAIEVPEAASVKIEVKATGTMASGGLDTFVTPRFHRADVLLVIDDTTAMAPFEQTLAQNFRHIAIVAESDPLMQVAVASSTSGKLQTSRDGSPVFAGAAAEALQKATQVGYKSSGPSRCFDAATRALEQLQTSRAFSREEAALLVLCVTASRDESTRNARERLTRLAGGNPFWLGVVAPARRADCLDDRDSGLFDEPGISLEPICSATWAFTLPLQCFDCNGAWGPRPFFLSTQVADPTTIHVFVDGVEVPAISPIGAPLWEFDAQTNAVRFVSQAPQDGQVVVVRSQPQCTR